VQVALAKRLVESSFADRAFFANNGNPVLAQIPAGRAPDRDDPLAEFLAFNNCFHSQTMGSVTLTCKSQ
jgi:acetylornithine aminotransferase